MDYMREIIELGFTAIHKNILSLYERWLLILPVNRLISSLWKYVQGPIITARI